VSLKEIDTMLLWERGPIYEPKDSGFRPWSISTLIVFLKGFGRLFRKQEQRHHVAKED
jgi:hypothetical protein